jgi:FkbM family methyltransferase
LIDIGANIGNICIPLIKQKRFERAICFEPDPANFKLLKVNTILNDLVDSMVLVNSALGGEPKQELEFELSLENFGDHRVRVSKQPGIEKEESRPVIKVNSTTLDTFLSENVHGIPEGVLIWIDVQGYEGLVLKGAKDTLARGFPLVIEFWPYGLNRAGTFALLFEALHLYSCYIDLGHKEISKRDLTELEILYSTYLNDASFMMDILILVD